MGRIAAEGPHLREYDALADGVNVRVIKLTDDPMCLRASLGGTREDGYYLTYRGGGRDILALLEAALTAFKKEFQ